MTRIVVPVFATTDEVDGIVDVIVEDWRGDGLCATPEALEELRSFIAAMSSTYVVGGVRLQRMPDGEIHEVSEH